MTQDILFAYPLRKVSDHQLQELGRTLWGWQLCGACCGRPSCSKSDCPWSRSKRLARFWTWYKEYTGGYVPDLLTEDSALRTHGDLHDIIRLIKTKPGPTRALLTREHFADRANKLSLADQDQAFNMAIAVLMMVNCSRTGQSFELLEHGSFQSLWRKDVSASQFVSEVFVAAEHPYFDKQTQSIDKIDIKSMITAKVLKKRAGLRFQGTTDLRHHLALNRKEGVVEIFHHTAVLKECLLASKDVADEGIMENCLQKGNIPRNVALEVLDTIHRILFPADHESQAMLSSLVSRNSFDEDCLRYESAQFRMKGEEESTYQYFGTRLAELYDEVQNPTPRGWFEKWLEQRSGARHVLLATLIGVIIAIILGALSLGVASFQTWIAWQQWKHPVSNR